MTTDATPNVLQLNKVVDKTSAVMDEFDETAKAAGFDLGPDADGIALALVDFFTDRERRDEHSDVLKAGA